MIEVLWHGRGGQGAFTAARLLGAAASLEEGSYALAFPSFGPERRGAPMRAFTKMDGRPIGDRSAITRADFVVYLDETLLADGWERELKPGGVVLVNSAKPASAFGDGRIVPLDADGLSIRYLGRPIPNTVFLGALCALCDRVDEEALGQAVRAGMPAKLHEDNLAIVAAAAQAVRAMDVAAVLEGALAGGTDSPDAADLADAVGCVDAAGSSSRPVPAIVEGREAAGPTPARPACRIPALAAEPLPPWQTFAANTCFAAGHLTDRNAGWRNKRPVISADACTGCLQCYLYCPDGAIYKTGLSPAQARSGAGAAVAVGYDFCKGCGVCVTVCAFDALAMVPEHAGSDDAAACEGAAHAQASASVEGGAR